MMANDWQRLKVWLKLNNKFDYSEYVAACEAEGCYPHTRMEFAQKSGMVASGMATYPDLAPNEAYLKFIIADAPEVQQTEIPSNDVRFEMVQIRMPDGSIIEQPMPIAKNGCCGGGEVR